MSEREEVFVTCACYGEGVWAVHDREDKQFYVSLWDSHLHITAGMPWRQRLRHIWRIVTRGTPYDDDVVMDYDEARKLADFITKSVDSQPEI